MSALNWADIFSLNLLSVLNLYVTFFLVKKVTKKTSQNDFPALFPFLRFATERGLKLFRAHLKNENSQLISIAFWQSHALRWSMS